MALLACDTPGELVPATRSCKPLHLRLAQRWEEDWVSRDYPGNRGPGVAIADYDGDGWLDLFWAVPTESVLYLNDGAGTLSEHSRHPPANGASGVDIDGDGDLDIVLATDDTRPVMLLRNQGDAVFYEQQLASPVGETKTPAWADVDGDGLLDLFVSGFVADPSGQKIESGEQVGDGNHLYRQQPDGSFQPDDDALPEEVFDALTYEGVFADVDLDGDPDLYLVNDHGHRHKANSLLLNDGTGTFSRAWNCACELVIAGMGGDADDLTGDGRPDLLMSDDQLVHLLEDDGSLYYVDTALARGLYPERESIGAGWATEIVDLDLDTWPDVLVAYGSIRFVEQPDRNKHATLHLNNHDLTWRDAREETGFSSLGIGRTVNVGDFDRDGRPDVVVSGIEYLELWDAQGGCGPAVNVRLDAGPGNPHGLGAKIDVTAGDRSWTQWHYTASTYSSSAPEVYLGAGEAETIDVVVTWRDGSTSRLEGAYPGGVYTISKD